MRRAPHFVAALVAMLLVAVTVSPVARAATRTIYTPQITNGHDAAAATYPFMVGILNANVADTFTAQFCGGALIDPSWVLTAAHCQFDPADGHRLLPSELNVLVGTTDLDGTGTRVAVDATQVHPGYDPGATGEQNDLALVHLVAPQPGPVLFYADLGDAALEEPGTTVTLLGWGSTSVDQSHPTYASHLQEATMPILANDDCSSFNAYSGTDMLCAGAPESDANGGVDACQGDSGGPLFATRDDGAKIDLGIVSYGPTCGFTPTAYTRISTYSQWITDTIAGKTTEPTGLPTDVFRLSGATRYATAATFATDRFEAPVPVAYLVTGASYPDALAVAPAAARHGGVVLLTERDKLPPETRDALVKLLPQSVGIIGGEGAISTAVEDEVRSLTGVVTTRIAGTTRYETAAAVSNRELHTLPPNFQSVFMASGASFADALGGAAAAGTSPAVPLLLTDPATLPDATAQELLRLHPTNVYVLGGTGAVSDAVADAIRALGPTVTRIAGANRYETSALIATTIFVNGAKEVILATGLNYPDGLVAGALGLPVLLVPKPDDVPAPIPETVTTLGAEVITVMGGPGAVSDAQARAVAAARQ